MFSIPKAHQLSLDNYEFYKQPYNIFINDVVHPVKARGSRTKREYDSGLLGRYSSVFGSPKNTVQTMLLLKLLKYRRSKPMKCPWPGRKSTGYTDGLDVVTAEPAERRRPPKGGRRRPE